MGPGIHAIVIEKYLEKLMFNLICVFPSAKGMDGWRPLRVIPQLKWFVFEKILSFRSCKEPSRARILIFFFFFPSPSTFPCQVAGGGGRRGAERDRAGRPVPHHAAAHLRVLPHQVCLLVFVCFTVITMMCDDVVLNTRIHTGMLTALSFVRCLAASGCCPKRRACPTLCSCCSRSSPCSSRRWRCC